MSNIIYQKVVEYKGEQYLVTGYEEIHASGNALQTERWEHYVDASRQFSLFDQAHPMDG